MIFEIVLRFLCHRGDSPTRAISSESRCNTCPNRRNMSSMSVIITWIAGRNRTEYRPAPSSSRFSSYKAAFHSAWRTVKP